LLTLRIDGDREKALKLLAENGIHAEQTKYSPVGVIIRGRRKRARGNAALKNIVKESLPSGWYGV